MQEKTPNISAMVEKIKGEVQRELRDTLPRRVGIKAVNMVKQNFRDGGFRNGGLRPWQKSQREMTGGKGASSRYGTLLSARNHLMSSTQHRITSQGVVIENLTPYAAIHNEGGTLSVSPTITRKMRRFAWAMYYRHGGKDRKKGTPLSHEAQRWLGLALTKKSKLHLNIKMPQRQFIGESKELREMVDSEIEAAIKRIKTKMKH